MLTKEALIILANQLPFGASTEIQKRLTNRTEDPHEFTADYIRRVLNPDDPRMNRIIIEEAVKYRNEILADNDNLENDILQS